MRRCSWARRRSAAELRAEIEARPNSSGPPALATRAEGTPTTRWPASRARIEKSSAASTEGSPGSNPPSASQTDRRTSIPAAETPRRSLWPSYWAWSSSFSTSSTDEPNLVMVSPYLAMMAGSSARMSLGPAIATDGAISTAPSRRARASGLGALSALSSHSHSSSTVGASPTWAACAMLEPNPSRGDAVTNWVGEAAASMAAVSSFDPASTATKMSGRRVWAFRAARVRARYAAPFRATRIAVTLGCTS